MLPSGGCVLAEVDEHGPMDLDRIGRHFGLSRERIRQIETEAMATMVPRLSRLGVDRDVALIGRAEPW